jgi:hypothetical protein
MRSRVSPLLGLLAIGAISLAHAAEPIATPTGITGEARAALQNMGKTLSAETVSFKARTLRVYEDPDGDFLHIVHDITITVRRPDRLAVTAAGDDGVTKLVYDGTQVSALDVDTNKYMQVAQTGNLDQMLENITERKGVDFPLADFLTGDPAKSFLTGVTSGREVGTVKIGGTPHSHFFFTQPGATELELWLEKNDRALPRRFIITYRTMPGQPSFVAEFSDWNFQSRPSDADFVFQPPPGATKVDITDTLKDSGQQAPNKGSR